MMVAMRRKTAKTATVKPEGPPKPPRVEPPAVSWEELLARAEASLDENGVATQAKREAAAEKCRARMEERGVRPSWNLDGVRRALAEYYRDCVLGECERGFRRVFAECGVHASDLFDAEGANPELRMVYEYIQKRRDEITRSEAKDLSRQAQAAQRRLVTEEGCDLNQRAVEVSLRATMKDIYGEDEKGGGGSDDKKGITYKFVNLTANWIVGPSEIAKQLKARPQAEAIDV